MSESKYRVAPVATARIPGGIPYIIGNEAAERFSFYGMKGVLVVFMTSYLFLMPGATGAEAMPEPTAIANYHLFTTAVYFTPILGALLSDILLGKYLTIISLSLVYCLGHGALAFMGAGEGINPGWMLFLGLGLISLGSGGIKPCVSAHVGDQFGKTNGHMLSKIYGWFYFSINVGAFLSTLLTPWLLEWYGPHLAFGVPGVLMAIATFLFWCGRHKFVHVPPGGMRWIRETFSWAGISAILKLGIIYIFVAVFWALFDQTGSSWVLQAEDLDRHWLGITWLSSQIQAVNPIMILIYIPLFTFFLYPAMNKVYTLTPIRKIAIGLFVMVIGFGMVSMLQGWIDAGEQPSIGWQIAAYAILTASEVMVSITCLEFSYTQAPRTMKSVIMALFLMSVSLGNIFTAGVNHFILVPSHATGAKDVAIAIAKPAGDSEVIDPAQLAANEGLHYEALSGGGFALDLAGLDGVLGGDDDIRLGFGPEGAMTGFINTEVEGMHEGIAAIGRYWVEHDRLPDAQTGSEIVGAVQDGWGHPLHYELRTRKAFIVSSEGPDAIWQSQFDVRAEVDVTSQTRAESAAAQSGAAESDLLSWAHPAQTWLESRRAELNAASSESVDATESVQSVDQHSVEGFSRSIRWDVGGATTLAGDDYFWFFTAIMLGTAVLFLPVAYLYKPHTYLQEEADG